MKYCALYFDKASTRQMVYCIELHRRRLHLHEREGDYITGCEVTSTDLNERDLSLHMDMEL